nr:hypothetical protein GCM10020063_106940 [Dactylosporangium thailandense]
MHGQPGDRPEPGPGRRRLLAVRRAAARRRARPKTPKLAGNPVLRDLVRDLLACRHSPAQISAGSAAEADDRAIPGHWEGDLIIGKDGRSAIGTVVERATRYVMLVHLGDRGRSAETVRDALLDTAATLPNHLETIPDLGPRRRNGPTPHQFSIAADMSVYCCDPHSPWQRGSNENTNGFLRQYFPKGTDLAGHSPEHLAAVAAELNGRPRQALGWDTPAERLTRVLAATS